MTGYSLPLLGNDLLFFIPKKIFTQELEGREEGEDPGKDGKRR
jgi:hypothetical protein